MVAAGAALVSQAAQADTAPLNDLVLGFNGGTQNSSTTYDYVLDLGASSGFTSASPNQDVTTSSGFSASTFNSIFSTATGANVGIVGGKNGSTADMFVSTLRTGVAATSYTQSGTEAAPPSGITAPNMSLAGGFPSAVDLGQDQNNGTGADASSWTAKISAGPGSPGTSPANWMADVPGANGPMYSYDSTQTITLDMWKNSRTVGGSIAGWSYIGDFVIDLSNVAGANGTASIVWDPVAVPEPAVYGLVAGAGLLLLSLRRVLSPKMA